MTPTNTFPGTYAGHATAHLLQAFDAGPARVRGLVAGLGRDVLVARPIDGKWSIQEIVVHVADSEIMGGARIRQTLAQSGRDFAYYHQDAWADALGYQSATQADLEAALDLFEALRRTTSRLLHRASDDDWALTGNHAEMGQVTLRQLLELYADHSERHVAQILERRALLGKPVELDMMLPKRLY